MPALQIKFFQTDPTAKADITSVSANAQKPWSNLPDLQYDNIPPPGHYATLEHNYTILDGTMEEFPDNTSGKTWGLWSSDASDKNGRFANPPTLDISFSSYHKSRGLTLYFYPHTDDYASRVRVTWYSTTTPTTALQTGEYDLSSNIGVIVEPAADFRHIKIEFLSTNIPGRYIKIFAIEYGIVRIMQDEEISMCRLLEEVDPTVESLSINTLNATVRTKESVFSPITSADYDDMMMRRQVLTVLRDGLPMGTFFLDEWEDPYQSGIEFNISAGDAMGVLDLYPFKGGMYANKLVSELLDEIFAICFPTGLITYTIDPVFAASRVTGWIPACPCGTAFQHIMFALNAIADTSLAGHIWIYPQDTNVTFVVPTEDQYRRGRDAPAEFVSGVDVVSHNYTPGAEYLEAQNGPLPLGENTVTFSEPLHSLTLTGGTIVSSGANHAVINVTTTGNVVVTGRKYVDNQRLHSVRAEISAGEVEAVKRYENYTLVSPNIGQSLAEALFRWLQNRIQTETDAVLGDLEVGYMARVKTHGRDVVGTIVSLDSNIRANKTKMVVIGNAVD